MARRGTSAWRNNISMAKRKAQRDRRDEATSVDEYEELLSDLDGDGEGVELGPEEEEVKPLAERMRTIDFETMAPLDIVVTRRFGRDGGS